MSYLIPVRAKTSGAWESDRAKRADCGVIPGNSAKIAARARPCEGGAGTRSTAARAAQIHQCLCCTMHHVRKLAVIYCNKMGARGHRAWRGQRPSELRAAAFVVAAAAATCCRCCRSEPLLGGTCCRRLLPPLAAAACCRRLLPPLVAAACCRRLLGLTPPAQRAGACTRETTVSQQAGSG